MEIVHVRHGIVCGTSNQSIRNTKNLGTLGRRGWRSFERKCAAYTCTFLKELAKHQNNWCSDWATLLKVGGRKLWMWACLSCRLLFLQCAHLFHASRCRRDRLHCVVENATFFGVFAGVLHFERIFLQMLDEPFLSRTPEKSCG